MLDRILGVKRGPGKLKPLPFVAYSVFGDPLHRMAEAPSTHEEVWLCKGGDHTVFRLLLGMAWLNHRTVRLQVADQEAGRQLSAWAEEAVRDITTMISLHADQDGQRPEKNLVETLRGWRAEADAFHQALTMVRETRFGVINTIEVAQSLLRLHDQIKDVPFTFTDRSRLAWNPSELQDLLQASREARSRANGLRLMSLANKLDIRLSALPEWTSQTLRKALDDRLERLEALIREYGHILFRLRALILAGHSGSGDREDPLRRVTTLILDEQVRHQSGLSLWQQAILLLEQELISDGWFLHFKGLQGISLEETDREIRSLHARIQAVRQWSSEWLEGAMAQQWLLAQPEAWQGLLVRAAQFDESEIEPTLTYWYVHGWLERALDPEIWRILTETPLRRELARQLPSLALEQLRGGWPDQTPEAEPHNWWRLADGKDPGNGDQVRLYWNCDPSEDEGRAFQFRIHNESYLPLEYLRLQQEWNPEVPSRRFALPFPFPTMAGLWEACPGRWRSEGPLPFQAGRLQFEG
jgi:hypothetical protein